MTEVMEKVQQSVPSLRFPGFKGEWPVVPMERVADIERGRFSPRPRNDPRFYGGAIPFVQTNDVVNCGGVIEQYSQTLNEEGLAVSKLFPAGSILMTIAANIGHTGVLQVDMACPDSLVGIKCKPDYHNYFLNHFLSTQQTTLEYLAPEGAQKNINLEVLRPFRVPNPTLPEQQKIAAFLGAVDRKIQQLKRKQALLEQYKKGVVQQLFSQELRFKREDGGEFPEWEEKRLGDVCEIAGGGTPDTDVPEYWNGDIQWFTPTEIKGKYVSKSKRTITKLGLQKSNAVLLPVGTILFTSRATIGEISFATEECATNQGFQSVIVSKGTSSEFVYQWILWNRQAFLTKAQGSTFIELSKKEMVEIPIQLPSLEEQTRIAGFLMALDAKVAGVAQAVAAAQRWKKGLLQQMFV
jgi:type I restriction enzyme S subunit